MSLLTDNVIPGNHGKVFNTDANKDEDLLKIKNVLLLMEGIKKVSINRDVFPKEITVYTNSLVKINDVEHKVKEIGFHVVPKGLFEL